MSEHWDKFLNGKLIETDVTPVIYRSWQRSLNYNVNRSHISQNMILSTPHLRELRDSQEDLIRAAEPVLPYIFQLLVTSNYHVLLSDKKGFILEAKGDGPFVNKAERIHLSPGVNWREDVKGTNAIGTALTENIPISISGWEHYVKENHFLTCCAAPITGIQGDTLGVIDISGEFGNNQERILEIAMLGAKMIEQNLRSLDINRQLSFYQQGAKLAIELLQQGFISINYSGIITDINPIGASLLGRKREDVIGKQVKEVFSTPKGWILNQKELDFQSKNSAGNEIISKLKPITDESGKSLGAVGTVQLNFNPEHFAAGWVGSGSVSRQILEKVQRAALTHSSILLQGESGTGKEIIAQMIHKLSPHKQGPFVALNCAALPGSLLESELFGYVDGAFTGARRGGQLGKFELANQGTIFLDEIGDMPLTAQVALLRVLQEKEVTRIGDTKTHKIDVRVIVASHKDLNTMVDNQTFRLDLYYRLKVISIELPPLRERLEDIRELVPYFIQKSCALLGRPLLEVEEEVYPYLFAHSWPGNVRELENCIEGMVALANTPILSLNDLPLELRTLSLTESEPCETHALLFQQTRQTIIDALAQTQGKIAPAARILGIGRNTLYRKIKEMNINI
ncbi:sigma-54-dependent Fis family transcriptional regulator [Desulfitobacterium metallireducens]|uniref:Transcriptional regulator n=1 Tax=Desulfitobacterium metallireducens DSM 15288 TaxID=871968 RepID=W0E9E3_9FIRM|nr:sigma-54-dependent Fis family transcriptional regulator [Desulfitobacterium metallireducens]AHF05839.1 transcriptional regulator [Desulfitobacterium metallireducens DSM 15288]